MEEHPAWKILIKHLDCLDPEDYPRFSVRKLAFDAMIEFTKSKDDKIKELIGIVDRLQILE